MEKVKVKLSIGDKIYPFNETQEVAQKMAQAAELLNKEINDRQQKHSGKTMTEILSIVALKICMKNLALEEYIRDAGFQEQLLEKELESYLIEIENNSR